MIFHEIIQGGDDWFKLRRGIPTASCFNKIITPTGKLSTQADEYAHLLLAEIITGENLDKFPPTYWMERGSMLEPEAAELYAFETGHILGPGGFMTDDKGRWGASPDRLILDGNDKAIGSIEIKCPAPWTHVKNLLCPSIDNQYIPQVQGQMLIGDLDFVDWFSYHPEMPPSNIHIERDEKFIEKLSDALENFTKIMNVKVEKLKEIGAL
jgi:hypothetical protein